MGRHDKALKLALPIGLDGHRHGDRRLAEADHHGAPRRRARQVCRHRPHRIGGIDGGVEKAAQQRPPVVHPCRHLSPGLRGYSAAPPMR